jgi:AhpD family alkylhydroperoxidase
MSENISFQDLPHGFTASLLAMDEYLRSRSLEPALRAMLATHVSQKNGCGFCIDLHWREAQKQGHDPRRLALLGAHHAAASFTPAENAALQLADALTDLTKGRDLGAAWDEAARHFERDEVADLCLAIAETNTWNRIARACGFAIR